MHQMPGRAENFSSFQLERLKHRRAIQKTLENIEQVILNFFLKTVHKASSSTTGKYLTQSNVRTDLMMSLSGYFSSLGRMDRPNFSALTPASSFCGFECVTHIRCLGIRYRFHTLLFRP